MNHKDLIGLILIFNPMEIHKQYALELLFSYGFNNIIDGWKKRNDIDLPPFSLVVRVPAGTEKMWCKHLKKESSIVHITTLYV